MCERNTFGAVLIVAGITGACPTLANAAEPAVKPGVYYCITERMVGIQSKESDKAPEKVVPFSGSIKPAKEKFILKIEEYKPDKQNLVYRVVCDEDDANQKTMFRVLACSNSTKYQTYLPIEKAGLAGTALLSTDSMQYTNGRNNFLIDKSLSYRMSIFDNKNSYLEEGYCETFE